MSSWDLFTEKIRNNAYRLPIPPRTSTANRARIAAGQGAGVGLTLVDGLGDGLARVNPVVGTAIGVATAPDAQGAIDSVTDGMMVSWLGNSARLGAEGGMVFAGLLMILRGTAQSLDRHEQAMRYTLGMLGYVSTLSRACAMFDENPRQLRFASPLVPDYIARRGAVHSDNRERKFKAGSDKMKQILRAYDRSAPARNGLTPARNGIAEIILRSDGMGRRNLRANCEDYIYKRIIKVNMNQVSERLRRWANS